MIRVGDCFRYYRFLKSTKLNSINDRRGAKDYKNKYISKNYDVIKTFDKNQDSAVVRNAKSLEFLNNDNINSNTLVINLKELVKIKHKLNTEDIYKLTSSLKIFNTNQFFSNSEIVSDTVWCYGSLISMNYKKMGHNIQQDISANVNQLLHNIELVDIEYNPSIITKILIGLARMKFSISLLSKRNLELILHSFNQKEIVEKYNSQAVSNALWSLGSIEGSKIINSTNLMLLLSQINRVSYEMTDQGISNTLIGLQRLGLKWDIDIPIEIQSALSTAICRVCFTMSPQAVGNTLYSLGMLGCNYNALTDRIQIALELSIRKCANKAVKKDAMQIIQGLALMKYNWVYLSKPSQDSICLAVYNQAKEWSNKGPANVIEIATILYSLVSLEAKWLSLQAPLRAALLIGMSKLSSLHQFPESNLKGSNNRLEDFFSMELESSDIYDDNNVIVSKKITATNILLRAISTIIFSLSKLDVDYKTLPLDVKQGIINSIMLFHPSVSGQTLCMITKGLNQIGVVWDTDVPYAYKSIYLNTVGYAITRVQINSNNDSLTFQGFSTILVNLGKMGVKWNKFSLPVQEIITNKIKYLIPSLNMQNLAGLMHIIELLELPWEEYNINSMIIHHFHKLMQSNSNHIETIGNFIYSLGMMKVSTNNIDINVMNNSDIDIINYIKNQEVNMSLRASLHILRGISNSNMYINTEWENIKSIILRRINFLLFQSNNDVNIVELAITVSCLGTLRDKNIIQSEIYSQLIHSTYQNIHLMELHHFIITVFGLVDMGTDIGNNHHLYDKILHSIRNRIKDCLMYKESVNAQTNFISLLSLLAALPYKWKSDNDVQSLIIDGIKLYSSTFTINDNKLLLQAVLSIYRKPGNENTKLKLVIDNLIGFFINNLQEKIKLLPISSDSLNENYNDPLIAINDQLHTFIAIGIRLNDTSSISLESRSSILLILCQKLVEINSIREFNWDAVQVFKFCNYLRQLGFIYDMLPYTAQKIILMTVSEYSASNYGNSNEYNPFNFLYELTMMKFTWNNIYRNNPSFANNIVNSFGENFIKYNYFNNNSKIRQFVVAVSSLSINWNDLDIQNKRIILQCFTEILRRKQTLVEEIMFLLINMGATWSSLPTRPRNSMALVLGNIAIDDVHNRNKIANVMQKLQAESRMIVKSLRLLL